MKKHPNLFLIGAPKSGTTSLAAELAQNPYIFLPEVKEPRYYDAHVFYDHEEDQRSVTYESYLDLYRHAPNDSRWLLDGSVFIFYSLQALKKILSETPEARFILVLRDPVSASKSMHAQRLKTLHDHLREVDDDFYKCFEKIVERRKGFGFPKGCRNQILFRYDLLYSYELIVPAVKSLLGEKLLVVRYEDYLSNPDEIHKRIFKFLDLDPGYVVEKRKLNPSMVVRRTILSRVIYIVAHWLRPYREYLKPVYSVLRPIAERLLNKRKVKRPLDAKKDKEIRDFFSETYDFLDRL